MNKDIFCKGYTWGFFSKRGDFQTEAAEKSMERLASNGLNWICIPVNALQESFASTRVFSDYERTQSDEDIAFAIKKKQSHWDLKSALSLWWIALTIHGVQG